MADNWYAGNANSDADTNRGWLLGHFVAPGDVRSTEALEVKWGTHQAGQRRSGWTTDERRTTLVILVAGRFGIDLSVGTPDRKDGADPLLRDDFQHRLRERAEPVPRAGRYRDHVARSALAPLIPDSYQQPPTDDVQHLLAAMQVSGSVVGGSQATDRQQQAGQPIPASRDHAESCFLRCPMAREDRHKVVVPRRRTGGWPCTSFWRPSG